MRFYSRKPAWGLLRMNSNVTLNPGNRLLITWVNMTYEIKDRYIPSIHFWGSDPWLLLYFPMILFFCYFFLFFCYFYHCLLVNPCFFFFVFLSLDNILSSQEAILTCLLSFWLIIKLYLYYYGSLTLYCNIYSTLCY